MMLLRGGWYESFGKPHDGLGYAPTMMAHSHGSTAISGITFYAADHFPPAYRDLLYIGNVVTNRINLDRLERHGSTYRAIQLPDFVVSDDPWFRPVDIKLGPDGALYVADFYNRIIGHYEVPLDHPGRDRERGRIWRIRYVGGPQPLDPPRNLTKLTTSQLVDELGHPNLTVRIMAANLLVERGKEQVEPAVRGVLRPQSSPLQRVHGMWVLERLGVLDDDTLLKLAGDIDPAVRVHVMRVLAERSEVHCCFLDLLRTGLTDPDAMVRRAAADALGRHPDPGNLRPLLDLRSKVPADDTHLLHTVRMALRNQLRPPDHWTKLPDPLPETDARAIADVAPGLATPQAGAYLVRHLQKYPETGETLLGQVRHAARHVADDLQGSLIDLAKTNKPGDIRHQATLLKAIQQGTQERGGKLGDDARLWAESLIARLLAAREADLQQLGIELAGSLKYRPAEPILVALAKRRDLNEKLRQAAVSSLVSIEPGEQIGLLVGLLLDINEKMPIREHAANVLAGINHPASRSELVRALTIVPARLQTIIAYGLAGSPAGAEQLLDAVSQGKASARLLQERPVEARLSQVKLPNLKDRLARLTAGLPPAEQRLQELLKQRQDGFNKAKPDIKLGALLYQKHCAGCHQIGNQGAKVGPQLDGIGIRGIDRLLEDIIDPNRNVDQAFRASTLALKNGQVVQGLVLREEGEVLIVADPQGKELRIAKKDIEERTVTQLSPMPANVIDQIPEAELYHLLGFLLEQRTPAGK
jgi:putative heme-binding domain-containing protein